MGRGWPWLAGLGVVVAIAVAAVAGARHGAAVEGRTFARQPRLTAGRVTGTAWSALSDASRRAGPPAISAAQVQRTVESTATSDHRLALAAGDIDAAIDLLTREASTALQPEALSDLGVAWLQRYLRDHEDRDLVRALDASGAAARRAPTMPEAHFNLALCLAHLGMGTLADREFARAMQLDATSGWAVEAAGERRRLARQRATSWERLLEALGPTASTATVRRVAGEHSLVVREYVEVRLLPAWAAAVQAGRSGEATHHLLRAETAIEGEPSAPDLETAVAIARRGETAIARAHAAYATAQAALLGRRLAEARAAAESAETDFPPAHPYRLWTGLLIATLDVLDGRSDAAYARAVATRRAAIGAGYRLLAGRCARLISLIVSSRLDLTQTATVVAEAIDDARATHDLEGEVLALTAQGGLYLDVGATKDGWRALAGSVRLAPRVRPLRRHAALFTAAIAAQRDGLPDAAFWLLREADDNARQHLSPELQAECRQRLAQVYQALGDTTAAVAALDQARALLDTVDSPAVRTRNLAEWHAVRAEILAEAQPDAAIDSVRAAMAFFDVPDWQRRMPRLRLTLARANARLGRRDDAVREARAGLAVVEGLRRSLRSSSLRESLVEQARDLYEFLVEREIEADRFDAALDGAEHARARLLTDAVADGRVASPMSLARDLPPDWACLYYVVLPNRIVTWTLTSEGTSVAVQRVTARDLAARVDAFRDVIQRRRAVDEVRRAAEGLFQVLISPSAARLAGRSTLVIVPHRSLERVPFAALRDPAGGWLGDRFAVGTSPSATALREALQAPAPNVPRSLLTLGSPSVAEPDLLGLPYLRAAATESRTIQAFYPTSRLVTGGDARPDVLLREGGSYDVVHVSGHAISNATDASRARLLLAPRTPGGSGVVTPEDVRTARFRQTQVVVLAACSTADGPESYSEGIDSLARPFLLQGVTSVVATLWPVDDRATESLMIALHRALAAGSDSWAALRAAQSALRRDARYSHPYYWAAAVVVGRPSPGPHHGRPVHSRETTNED